MITTGGTVGLTEWIIDGRHALLIIAFIYFSSNYIRASNTARKYVKTRKNSNVRKTAVKAKESINVPPIVYKRAEDMPGWEKFTLDEVIYPEKEDKVLFMYTKCK